MTVDERFTVRVASPKLRFNAAHFVAFGSDSCEPIHGHDFRVSVTIEGQLSPTGWIVDFVVLEEILHGIVADFDHALLIPEASPWVNVIKNADVIEITVGARSWRFPSQDCRFLPIPNVTTELLTQYIGMRVREQLLSRAEGREGRLTTMTVELSEAEGCTASWSCALARKPDLQDS